MAVSITKSNALAFLLTILLGFFLIGCESSSSSNSGGGNTPEYTITFYSGSDIFNSTVESEGSVNITLIAEKLNVDFPIYTAGGDPVTAGNPTYENYNLIQNTNFYDTSSHDFIEIRTQKDLNNTRKNLSGKYILLNDIQLKAGEAGFDEVSGWLPIGNDPDAFNGTFIGGGHKITNIWVNRTTDNFVGLFGYINNATIKDLSVEVAEGKEIKGDGYVGAIAGGIDNHSSIINSYSMGDISGGNGYCIGGITGIVYDRSIVTNSYSTANINGNSYIGGITGTVSKHSSITNSYSKGNVSGTGEGVGGITGSVESSSSVTNSYASGNVSGRVSVGGIAGRTYEGGITIQNNAAINLLVYANCYIDCYVNRVVGRLNIGADVSDNFALESMTDGTEKLANGGFGGVINDNSGEDRYDMDLQKQTTYEDFGWDFTNIWKIDEGNSYPHLYWED
jgi:hypothetical protein